MNDLIKIQWVIVFFLLAIIPGNAKSQSSFIWGKQFGTAQEEYVLNHVIDQCANIYISGKTTGVIDGQNLGKNDGFITRIDSLGNSVWTKQFGTSEDENILWSAIDNKDCIYITGTTNGTLGQSSFGKSDGFIMKLDATGNKIFIVQFGTPADDTGISITGDGKSTIYVCGSTWGDIAVKNKGMIDAYAGSFTDKGGKIRFTQFGTEGFDIALQLITDDELNIYVGGSTSGNLGCDQIGEGDCFLTKINSKGDIVWSDQFGTDKHDGIRGVAFNNKISDNLLVSGILNLPPSNAFLRMYQKDGSLLWEEDIEAKGINDGTSGKDVQIDNQGNIYHLGLTKGNLYGSHKGEGDVYLVKLGLDKRFMNR